MVIVKGMPAYRDRASLAINHFFGEREAGFEGRRRHDDFERGTRLKEVRNGAVAPECRVVLVVLVAVKVGVIGKSQDAPRFRFHHDGNACLGLRSLYTRCELALRDVLDGSLQTEYQGMPLNRWLLHLSPEGPAQRVHVERNQSRGPLELLVVLELQAASAVPVHVYESQ